ncbi:Increased rDNA silencing protein [Saccharomyces pastorianus]|uniref:Increased rDNA silencing protein n=1 Tax=Saccharomyces pastorianus TaxID=27292 RepID=A0A6C1EC92_SACPS|nr:Increased rDNA silencing protein [Saccharomyces pastorianus]
MRLSFNKQRHHGGTTVALTEQGASDSLHAAQAIFQNHSTEGTRPCPPFTVNTNAQTRTSGPSLPRQRQQEQKKARIRTKQVPSIKTTTPNGVELPRAHTPETINRDNAINAAQMAAALAHSQSKLNSDNNHLNSSPVDTIRVLGTPKSSVPLGLHSRSYSRNASNDSLTLGQRTPENDSHENLISPPSSSRRLSSCSGDPTINKESAKFVLKYRPLPPLQPSLTDNSLQNENENMSSVSIDSKYSLNVDTSDVASNRSQTSLSQTINQLSLYESEPSIASSSTTTTTANNQGGGLQNLVPNYSSDMRKKKLVSKFKRKVFGAKPKNSSSQYEMDAHDDEHQQQQSSMKFRTTLRKSSVSTNTENDQVKKLGAGNVKYKYNPDSDTYDFYADTDSDSGSDPNQDTLSKPRKRDRIKRKIKKSANKTTHHRPIHRTRKQKFNEDKPWKSHTDITFVTDSERKRYESMWVSNRHRHLDLLSWWPVSEDDPTVMNSLPEDGLILNIIVHDIWKRSNVPSSLLAEIYAKVDSRKDGTLDRKSFIVGMWLVDQCLYGRKLPNVVEQCVWDSVDRYASTTVVPVSTLKAMAKQKKKQMKEEIKNIKKENRVVLVDHNSTS